MSILGTRAGKLGMFKAALVCLAASLGCFVCGVVIHHLVHAWFMVDYHSDYLTYAFAYPLIGGAMVSAAIAAIPWLRMPGLFVANVYCSGIAALIAGSILRGTLDVAGKSSSYLSIFAVAGWVMVSIGVICYVAAHLRKPHRSQIVGAGSVDAGQSAS